MANRGYSGSNVMVVRNESSNDMSLVAMLASCSPVALQVQRAGGAGLEDAVASCCQKRFFSPTFEASTGEDQGEEDTGDDCTQHVEKKRRLSTDQVRSLEKSFEIENKLEPEKKMQLARDLGLMPRQVAVWFQNRRARWKTKQLERDFDVLTADYNRLKTDYDAVLTEKKKLQMKIESLTGKMKVTAPVVVALPERNKESETPSEESVKLEIPPELPNASKEVRREEGSSLETISSNSISTSEVLNVDSPRTMDSAAPPLVIPMNLYPELSPDMDSNAILHFPSDNLLLEPLDCKLISVKPEDGSYQDESCGYMLTQMDDEKQPWWDWP